MDARMAALARQLEAIRAAVEAALLLVAAETEPPGCAHRRTETVSGFGAPLVEFCHDCCRMLRNGRPEEEQMQEVSHDG